ncbi:uncharacterized protein [Saccopteryx leptura]|uniref:uncharacterized protein isoform X2 n=1 Tax=Saccopteryx leptura TaxID=249018 RepID=UPI00339C6F1B
MSSTLTPDERDRIWTAARNHADQVHLTNDQMPVGVQAVPDTDPNWDYQIGQTGWIEAFPTFQELASTVAPILVARIIPQFGLPTTIQSDNGLAFTAPIVQQVAISLIIAWRLHIPYHPQSSGTVERAHGILKGQLTKLSIETASPWHSPETEQPHETPLDSAPLSWFMVDHF